MPARWGNIHSFLQATLPSPSQTLQRLFELIRRLNCMRQCPYIFRPPALGRPPSATIWSSSISPATMHPSTANPTTAPPLTYRLLRGTSNSCQSPAWPVEEQPLSHRSGHNHSTRHACQPKQVYSRFNFNTLYCLSVSGKLQSLEYQDFEIQKFDKTRL